MIILASNMSSIFASLEKIFRAMAPAGAIALKAVMTHFLAYSRL